MCISSYSYDFVVRIHNFYSLKIFQAWQFMPVISELSRLGWENLEFEARMSYTRRAFKKNACYY